MFAKTLPTLSILVFLSLWQLLAWCLQSSLLPLPQTVAHVFFTHCQSGELPYHLGVTLLRLLVSFFISMSIGCVIGVALGRNEKLNAFLSPR